jgi:hypothetical protein
MSEVNARISISNLVQMDRLQNDAHRGPMVHQEQNAETARQDMVRRMQAPVQPDNVEGKIIDPNARREEERKKKKKKQQQDSLEKPFSTIVGNRGRVIDYEA